MSTEEQEIFISKMYHDLFHDADVSKIANYCSADFVEENNYDILDYNAFEEHIEDLNQRADKANFDFEFIVNIPGKVVIRTIVTLESQIDGAPPISLLMSYWQFNEDGLVNYCKEVEFEE